MKKLILPVLAVMAMGTASAQFNVGLSVGYGIGTPGQVLGTEATITSQKNIYGTLGGGLNINLLPGYSFGDHFGVELGLNGFIGSKMTIQDVDMSVASLNYQRSSNQFRISPAFVVKSGGERLNVYAKAGLVFPVLGSTVSKIEDNRYSNPLFVQSIEAKTTGKFSVGFTGAFGASLNLGSKFSLFAEVGANSIQVKSKETKYTKIEVNGTDQLAGANEFQKRIKYVDELTPNSNTMGNPNMDSNKAKEELRQVSNFSSFFLQVGFKISFGD
ncbi:hypothetical protein D3C87_34580 [compost metagenome]